MPSKAAISNSIRAFAAVGKQSRVLAVIDVSGSMGARTPGFGTATRLDLVAAAAGRGLGLYPDTAHIGMWVNRVGRLGVRRTGLGGGSCWSRPSAPCPGCRTETPGSLTTTLAAAREVRSGWDPHRVNSVVLLTDGHNDDRQGLSLGELLRTLRRESGSGRTVPVITIGYGPASDVSALRAISAATGGASYLAKDPHRIDQVFLDAVGRRACAPTC